MSLFKKKFIITFFVYKSQVIKNRFFNKQTIIYYSIYTL